MIWGIVLQLILGLLILRTEPGKTTFSFLGKQVEHFQSHVLAGVTFVFGEKYSDFEFIFKVYFNQIKIRWVFFLVSYICLATHYTWNEFRSCDFHWFIFLHEIREHLFWFT